MARLSDREYKNTIFITMMLWPVSISTTPPEAFFFQPPPDPLAKELKKNRPDGEKKLFQIFIYKKNSNGIQK